jgi:hypothetical protein
MQPSEVVMRERRRVADRRTLRGPASASVHALHERRTHGQGARQSARQDATAPVAERDAAQG